MLGNHTPYIFNVEGRTEVGIVVYLPVVVDDGDGNKTVHVISCFITTSWMSDTAPAKICGIHPVQKQQVTKCLELLYFNYTHNNWNDNSNFLKKLKHNIKYKYNKDIDNLVVAAHRKDYEFVVKIPTDEYIQQHPVNPNAALNADMCKVEANIFEWVKESFPDGGSSELKEHKDFELNSNEKLVTKITFGITINRGEGVVGDKCKKHVDLALVAHGLGKKQLNDTIAEKSGVVEIISPKAKLLMRIPATPQRKGFGSAELWLKTNRESVAGDNDEELEGETSVAAMGNDEESGVEEVTLVTSGARFTYVGSFGDSSNTANQFPSFSHGLFKNSLPGLESKDLAATMQLLADEFYNDSTSAQHYKISHEVQNINPDTQAIGIMQDITEAAFKDGVEDATARYTEKIKESTQRVTELTATLTSTTEEQEKLEGRLRGMRETEEKQASQFEKYQMMFEAMKKDMDEMKKDTAEVRTGFETSLGEQAAELKSIKETKDKLNIKLKEQTAELATLKKKRKSPEAHSIRKSARIKK
jgi:hypothetical protein